MSRPRAEPKRRSVAEPLVKKSNTEETVAWFCTNCGTIYKTKDDAERCGNRPSGAKKAPCTEWECMGCGEKASPYQWFCYKCLAKKNEQREDLALKESKSVIDWKDYPKEQPVFYHGEYYQCLEDLFEHCELENAEIPERVWATKKSVFNLNAEDILESAWDRWLEGDDIAERDRVCGEEEFVLAVESFNAMQDVAIFEQCNIAVILTGSDNDGS